MSVYYLYILFGVSAIVTWVAGIWLTRSTDAIDSRFRLGDAFGGMLLLGISANLPEIAVVISAALNHNYDVIIGALLGGIAIRTVVLALLDFYMKEKKALSYAAASLTIVLEANLVILVTVIALIGIRTPAVINDQGLSITSLAIAVAWLFGVWLIYKSRKGLSWRSEAIEATPGRIHAERRIAINHPRFKNKSIFKILLIFTIAALAALIAGVGLQYYGISIANHYGIATGFFAATFIALATTLPEISTGIASIRLRDYQLAFSDIFGSNAFSPVLFIVGNIISGEHVLKFGTQVDVWFAALGILLTSVYIIGLILRPKKLFLRMGYDSLAVVIIYIICIVILALDSGF